MTARSHTLFVLCVALAGAFMLAVGMLRLRLVSEPSRYSRSSIVTVYSAMILFGAALIVFVVHWRFFVA